MSPELNRPPPASRGHLAPFLEGPRPWLVLARNALPVVGVYALGWSAEVVIFQLWFDGVTALGAMLALQIRAFASRGGKPFEVPPGLPPNSLPFALVAAWLFLWLILGIPYWFTLLFFGIAVFDGGAWGLILGNPGVWAALAFVLVSNLVEESRRGYGRMSDAEIRLEFNWDFTMHLARVSALLLVTFVLRLGLIVGLALALSYIEIYPMRTLRFLGGDKVLEAGNEDRSRD
jgi:hypothetical protein